MSELLDAVNKSRAWACYDCGKCTATCPLSRVGGGYSPRRHVVTAHLGDGQDILENGSLFRCLTCAQCDQRCPAEVEYTSLIQRLREIGHGADIEPQCPHGGALHSVMRMMAAGGTQQNRLDWLDDDLRTAPHRGEVMYWTGCTMYYDAFFGDYGVATLDGTRAAIRLLNRCGVEPVVSPDERCCGHDLLWNGDRDSFRKLAEHNLRLVADSGAETLVTSCAECLRTWKLDYPDLAAADLPRILHISEFLEEHGDDLAYRANGGKKVTFQDPCRLGRHLGIYDPPRNALRNLPGIEVVEMPHTRHGATCCAGGTWSHCDRFVKEIQVGRLREARATGADVMATACPKCQVHFRCAMKDPNLQDELEIEMRDVAELAAAALET